MPTAEIALRTAAFFMLTSVANILGVILIGVALAVRVLPGETNLARRGLRGARVSSKRAVGPRDPRLRRIRLAAGQELVQDRAVQAADTLLLTVPNQLGVDHNAHLLETIARGTAPARGWGPKDESRARNRCATITRWRAAQQNVVRWVSWCSPRRCARAR
jgi:hypothetical protein